METDRQRPAERRLVKPVMLFMFSAFVLLGLKDFDWFTFALAVLVPFGIYAATLLLPRLFPADTLLLALVNFLCALGILTLYRTDPARGISQIYNYAIGVGVMVMGILYIRFWQRLKATVPMIAVAAVVFMALPVFFGEERNGAKAWIALFGVSFQPSEIVKLAQSITEEQRKEMHALQDIEPYEIVNVSYDSDTNFMKEEGYLTHLIGVLTTENNISDKLDKVPVEACTWAVFPNEGPFPSTLQQTMARIYSEWLPASDYEVINAPSFSFTKMNPHKKDHAYSKVWIPVQKK